MTFWIIAAISWPIIASALTYACTAMHYQTVIDRMLARENDFLDEHDKEVKREIEANDDLKQYMTHVRANHARGDI
jgi:hypothetical protein